MATITAPRPPDPVHHIALEHLCKCSCLYCFSYAHVREGNDISVSLNMSSRTRSTQKAAESTSSKKRSIERERYWLKRELPALDSELMSLHHHCLVTRLEFTVHKTRLY